MQAETDTVFNALFDSVDHALWQPYWENIESYAVRLPELETVITAEAKISGSFADLPSTPLASPVLSISSIASSPVFTALNLSSEPFLNQLTRLDSDGPEEIKEVSVKKKYRIRSSNIDEAREKKKIQNRQSAANYRNRRDDMYRNLEAENAILRKENFELKQKLVSLSSNRYRLFKSSQHLEESPHTVDYECPAPNQILPIKLNR